MKSMSDAIPPQPPSRYPDNDAPSTGATVDIALSCQLRRKTDVKPQSMRLQNKCFRQAVINGNVLEIAMR